MSFSLAFFIITGILYTLFGLSSTYVIATTLHYRGTPCLAKLQDDAESGTSSGSSPVNNLSSGGKGFGGPKAGPTEAELAATKKRSEAKRRYQELKKLALKQTHLKKLVGGGVDAKIPEQKKQGW